MVANIDKLYKAFESEGLDFGIYYSVKTNNAKQVLKTISQKCGYEIVSAYEWELIKPFKPKTVVLNGPSKSQNLIQDILDSGIETLYFNADNDTDFEILKEFQDKLGKQIKLGIRVYFNKEGVWSRFGFDIDSEKLKQYVESYGKFLSGFHFHFSTNNFKLANYETILSKIGALIKQLSLKLEYIDIGGGLPGANEYMYQSLIYEKLPQLITNSPVKNIAIFSEVGRYVVANAFNLETQVVSLKQIADHEYDITVDTNILHFPCYWEKKFNIDYQSESKSRERIPTTVNIFGNSCMQVDEISPNYLIPVKPIVGDKVVIENVGAYSLSQASNFISKIPAVREKYEKFSSF